MNPLLSEFEAEAYDLHGGVYELYDGDLETAPLNKALLAWEWAYNTVRPHRSLEGLTPTEYLERRHPELLVSAGLSHIC